MKDESHRHFHHHIQFDPRFEVRLEIIEGILDLILENEESIIMAVADLTTAVAKNTESVNKVVTFIESGGGTVDMAAIDAAVAMIDESSAKLDKAVADHS